MEEEAIRCHLIKYIVYKELPLSVLSNYINYEEVIKRNRQDEITGLYLNISAVYLSCKVEGQHLCVNNFRRSITKFLSIRYVYLMNDIKTEEILKHEAKLVILLDYKFVFNCFFQKLYGILILKGKTKEFEVFKGILFNKILKGEVSSRSFNDFLKSL